MQRAPKRSKPDMDPVLDFPINEPAPRRQSRCVKFSELESKINENHECCWGCVFNFGKSKYSDDSPMAMLYKTFEDNYEKTSLRELVRLLKIQYNNTIYKPLIETNFDKAMDWPEETLKEHITVHMRDDRFTILCRLRRLEIINSELSDMIFVKMEDTEDIEPDPKLLKSFESNTKLLNETQREYNSLKK